MEMRYQDCDLNQRLRHYVQILVIKDRRFSIFIGLSSGQT